jgi:hypothetical protein
MSFSTRHLMDRGILFFFSNRPRKMKPGAERNEALKKAGQLQSAADMMGYLKSNELRPPK